MFRKTGLFVSSTLICIAEMKGMAANVWACAYEREQENKSERERRREILTIGAVHVMNPEFNDHREIA